MDPDPRSTAQHGLLVALNRRNPQHRIPSASTSSLFTEQSGQAGGQARPDSLPRACLSGSECRHARRPLRQRALHRSIHGKESVGDHLQPPIASCAGPEATIHATFICGRPQSCSARSPQKPEPRPAFHPTLTQSSGLVIQSVIQKNLIHNQRKIVLPQIRASSAASHALVKCPVGLLDAPAQSPASPRNARRNPSGSICQHGRRPAAPLSVAHRPARQGSRRADIQAEEQQSRPLVAKQPEEVAVGLAGAGGQYHLSGST